jgi:PAS domain S-box-containing protein
MNYDFRELNNIQKYIKNLHMKIHQKQHKTKRINEQYKNLLESISDYIFVMNYEKKIEMVNPSLEKFTGIPHEMILGKKIYEVFPDYYNNIIENKINQVLASQKPGYIIDKNFFMDDNKDNWFEVNIYPTNEGVLCLCSNITKLKQAEVDYKLTAERYKAIVENQSELICRYTPDYTINFVNDGFCKFFNKEKEDLIGFYYPFLKDIPQEYRVQLTDKLHKINYHNPKNSIVTKVIINKKTKWIKWINKGIFDDKKQLLEYQSVGSDITQNRNMELTIRKTQQRLRRILDSIPLGVILTDPLGTILYLNRKMVNFIPKGFFKNLEYKSYLKPFSIFKSHDGNTYPKNDLPIYKALSGYSSYTDDIIIFTPDNRRINIEMWSAPILDDEDNIEYAVSTISDISSRKESEFKMKDLNKRLKDSNKELAQFAYTVSHDLQQPLRGITGFSELLEEEYKNRLDRNGIEYIKYIKESAYKVSQLIKSLLQYSRLDNKEKKYEYANLFSILNETLLSLSIQIEESKSEIRIHNMDIPEIFVDKRLIESVFLNLISNAIKFKRDEPPFIEIKSEDREHEIMISVRDNGIGIREKDFDDIFVIFQRLHDESEYPGSGLGLAMCKKIIEKHKGKIWVESEYNKGTTFYFTISKNLEQIYG